MRIPTRTSPGGALLAALVLLFPRCSPGPTEVAGGASDNPNAFAGILVDGDHEPVGGARVLLVDMEGDNAGARSAFAAETTHTAQDGAFLFDSVQPGRYNVEGLAGDTLIGYARDLVKSATVAGNAGTIPMARPGSLTGTITTNVRDALVIVALEGTHYRLVPDAAGAYTFSPLPPGAFQVSISVVDTSAAGHSVLDTTLTQVVRAGDTSTVEDVLVDSPFDSSSLRRVTINTTRTGAGVAEDVYDFPLLLRLDATMLDFSVAADSGRALHFTRGKTVSLPHEVELWDAAGERAVLWVALDTVFGDSVQTITMSRGGAPGAAPAAGPVFSPSRGFEAVWHLGEESAGDTGAPAVYEDATGAGYDGDDYVSASGKEGIVGRGQALDGVDDYILIPRTVRPPGDMTVSCWIKSTYVPATENTGFRIVSTYAENAGSPYGFQLRTHQNDLVFTAGDGTPKSDAQAWDVVSATWQHVVAVYESGTGTVTFFVNGERMSTEQGPTRPQIEYGDARTYLSHPLAWTVDGNLDEIRVSSVVRSAAWVRLCYENQKVRQTLVE